MTVALQLHPLRPLVLIAQRGAQIELNGLTVSEDGTLVVRNQASPFQFRFRLDERDFAVDIAPASVGFTCRMSAMAGPIPFSVEDIGSRLNVLELVRACRNDRRAQFQIGKQQSLWLMAEVESMDCPSPEAVLFETVKLVGIMRPYLSLAAAYLPKPHVAMPTIVPGSSRTH